MLAISQHVALTGTTAAVLSINNLSVVTHFIFPFIPYDTLCLGRPNVWRVGEPPEYLLWDYVGDGKIDIKIVCKFAADGWWRLAGEESDAGAPRFAARSSNKILRGV
jgi:hypothetical protein